jgi:hypothetical protein
MSSAAINLATLPFRTLQVMSSAAIDLATVPFRRLTKPRLDTPAKQGTSDSFAQYLERILKYPDKAKITVRELLGGLESRAFGLPLAVLSTGEIVPVPVPGFTWVISVPMAAIGAQMVVDRERLWLPSSLLNRRVSARLVKRIARAMLPTVRRLDRISGPRASIVTGSAGRRLAGLCVLLLSLLIALPIPGTNTVLALTVFVIALGLIRGDGLVDRRRHGAHRGRRRPYGNCYSGIGRRRFWRLTGSSGVG